MKSITEGIGCILAILIIIVLPIVTGVLLGAVIWEILN